MIIDLPLTPNFEQDSFFYDNALETGSTSLNPFLPPVDQLAGYEPQPLSKDREDQEKKIPRFFHYKGGLEEIDENRQLIKTSKQAFKALAVLSFIYSLAGYFALPQLPLWKHSSIIFITYAVKEFANVSLKRYLYFGNLISSFDVLKEQLAKSRLKLLTLHKGLELSLYNHRNERIDAVYFLGKNSKVDGPTVLYFNSAAGFYEVNEEWIERYLNHGYNVLTFNYPGYSDSESYPSHRNSFLAGKVAMRYLKEAIGLKNEQILAHGHSLGGPHAAFMAAFNPGVNLCVDRSFSVLTNVVKEKWGHFVQFISSLIVDGFDINTNKYFEQTKGKKWVIQSRKDKTIPLRHGMAKHSEKVIWHQLNYANAHQDELTEWEYMQHFNFVQDALGLPLGMKKIPPKTPEHLS